MVGPFKSYLPVSARDRRHGLYVTSAGHAWIQPGQIYPPPIHPRHYNFEWKNGRVLHDFALVYIAAGQGVLESRHGGQTRLSTHSAFFLFPNEWHRYRPDEESGWEEYWITFGGNIPEAWQKEGFFRIENPAIENADGLSLESTFDEVLRLLKKGPPQPAFTLAGLCHLMVGRVLGLQLGESEPGQSERRLHAAADYLRLHAGEDVNLEETASRYHFGYTAFRRAFRQHFGLPPHRYHQNARLTLAKEMLVQTRLPLKAIAEELNYASEFYFMQVFKQTTGSTPTQWRLQHRQRSS